MSLRIPSAALRHLFSIGSPNRDKRSFISPLSNQNELQDDHSSRYSLCTERREWIPFMPATARFAAGHGKLLAPHPLHSCHHHPPTRLSPLSTTSILLFATKRIECCSSVVTQIPRTRARNPQIEDRGSLNILPF